MNYKELHNLMLDYVAWAHLWLLLEPNHSDEDLNDLMLRLLAVEEKVLRHFGLPPTLRYGEQFQLLGLKEDFKLKDVDQFLEQLEVLGREYLLSETSTDMDLIKKAQEEKLNAEEVLPEISLKLQVEPYYMFLYEEYLLTQRINAEAFLKEIRVVSEHKLAGRILNLSLDPNPLSNSHYKDLGTFGLQFLDPFLISYPRFSQESSKYFKN